MPAISVIMAAFNEETGIERAIDSLLAQTFREFELIIVNDGSTDETVSVIKSYDDPRIHLLNKPNSGLADSLNFGLRHAHGEFIARLDADDQAAPDRLQRQFAYMATYQDIGVLGSWVYIKNASTGLETKFCPPTGDRSLRTYLKRDNPFAHSSVMIRRPVLEKVGGYSLIHPGEDYDLWIKIAGISQLEILPEFLVTRYDESNFLTRPFYKNLNMYKMYRNRLFNQWKAACQLGWDGCAPFFMLKTLGQMAHSWCFSRKTNR
jgi:glycosyltransferase involved in cell wall biosynthesis